MGVDLPFKNYSPICTKQIMSLRVHRCLFLRAAVLLSKKCLLSNLSHILSEGGRRKKGMKSVVRSTYRKALGAASSFVTAEEQGIARTRFVEFLPPMFTLPDDTETLPNIVRRAFRFTFKTDEERLRAVTASFQFIKDVSAEHSEVEVLAHWARIGSRRRAAQAIPGSHVAERPLCDTVDVKKNAPASNGTLSVAPCSDSSKDIISCPVWMDGVILISYAYQRLHNDKAQRLPSQSPSLSSLPREYRDWQRHILWGQRPRYKPCEAPRTKPPKGVDKKSKNKKKGVSKATQCTTSPYMVLRKDAWVSNLQKQRDDSTKRKKGRSSIAPPVLPTGSGAIVEQESYTCFKRNIAAQLDDLVEKVRTALVVEQIALLEHNIRKKPKRQPAPGHHGLATIINSNENPLFPSKTDYFQKKITRKAMKVQKDLDPKDNKEILGGVSVETITRGAIRVLLEDFRFSAITVSPLEGFLIDKVLESRVGSVSVLSILLASILRTLGVQANVTMDQRCPMIKVEGFRELVCFVNLADGGSILTPDEALEYHVKSIQSATHARTALKAADPRVVYCGILASMLVASNHQVADASGRQEIDGTRSLLRAQLLYLSRVR